MKIAARNIDGFVKKPSSDALAVLVYGPDEGLIRERLDILTGSVVADIRDPFSVVNFSGDDLAENPAKLMDEALSISMLGGRRVVRVRDASDRITPVVKDVLSALKAGDNLILLEAGELPPRSSLRSLLENAKNAAALPCYVEDAQDIGRVIGEALKAAGYAISSEALTYMAGNVIGNRAIARSEAEKLVTYAGSGRKTISLDDVTACIGDSAALSLDDLARNVASGRFAEAERILGKVLSEGIPAVAVLRTLQNHFMRLHVTKSRMQKGEEMEAAMKKLRPQVFFKIKSAFEAQLANWSLPRMEQALQLLAATEARCKQTASQPDTLCSHAVLSTSQMGKRAFSTRQRA
ncbi:MAG: DNA polymerase III subunit delta [Pseudomonadota bacterium]